MTHTQDKASILRQGVIVFIYLAVLTLLEYFVAVAMDAVLLLVVVAVVKAGLVLWYFMHIYRLNQDDESGDRHSLAYKTGTNRIGLWLFLLSDAFVFAGLMVVRINLLGLTRPHLNQALGLIVTAVLLISSFFMNRAESSMAHGDKKGFLNGTLITMLLGLGFFLGVVLIEWHSAPFLADFVLHLLGEPAGVEPLTPSSGAAGAVFFMMTGMHAFHVLTGLIFLLVVYLNGRRDIYTAEKHWAVEAAAVYWHFVDVVWIFFYPALYLIGHLG
jgi:cytochrome c oxidase subunit 3